MSSSACSAGLDRSGEEDAARAITQSSLLHRVVNGGTQRTVEVGEGRVHRRRQQTQPCCYTSEQGREPRAASSQFRRRTGGTS
jgi:hypothetical protein